MAEITDSKEMKISTLLGFNWDTLHERLCLPFLQDAEERRALKSRERFAKQIFPPEFHEKLFYSGTEVQGTSRTIHRRVFLGLYSCRKRMTGCAEYLRQCHGHSYHTLPCLQSFRDNWDKLLQPDAMPPVQKASFRAALDQFLRDNVPEEGIFRLRERLSLLLEREQYTLFLACCSLLASTLTVWPRVGGRTRKATAEEEVLLQRILPQPAELNPSVLDQLEKARKLVDSGKGSKHALWKLVDPLLQTSFRPEVFWLMYRLCRQLEVDGSVYLNEAANLGFPAALTAYYSEKAQTAFGRLQKAGNDPAQIQDICLELEGILAWSAFLPDRIIGEICYRLYLYALAEDGNYLPASGLSAYDYLKKSFDCNHKEARELWRQHEPFSLNPKIIPPDVRSSGESYLNCGGRVRDVYLQSLPESWKKRVYPFDPAVIGDHLENKLPKKFLLLSDDPAQNLRQAVDLLQLIREKGTGRDLEIFLRGDPELCAPLVDTALSHMPEFTIPVYILDEAKLAAQQLLFRHPLFYPIRALRPEDKENVDLHFLILGSSKTAQWLILESFGMLLFPNVRCHITLYAPDGAEVVAELKDRCPGLDVCPVSEIHAPVLRGENCAPDSRELLERILQLEKQKNTYCYFAVASDSPADNLRLAKKLRESLIRSHIRSSSPEALRHAAPIAFYCPDDHMAGLSRSLVVEKEPLGGLWYNSWNLIPFGEPSAAYSWSNLGQNHTLDQLAQCIHLQYFGITPERAARKGRDYQEAMQEYYGRSYNRDSSHAVALSLPYRLFQFRDHSGNPIMPRPWSILDSSAYCSENQLNFLSRELEDSASFRKDVPKVAKWEHDRWVLWMLSRGWMPGTLEDAVFAFREGNPRQQLFVARLHPCICPYEDLRELSEALRRECGIGKDFYSADVRNVTMTPRILRHQWLKENPEIEK